MKNDKMKLQYRVNEQIHAREVRVISEGNAEVMPTRQALELARKEGGVFDEEKNPSINNHISKLITYY